VESEADLAIKCGSGAVVGTAVVGIAVVGTAVVGIAAVGIAACTQFCIPLSCLHVIVCISNISNTVFTQNWPLRL